MIDPAAYAERTNSEHSHQTAIFMHIAKLCAHNEGDGVCDMRLCQRWSNTQLEQIKLLFAIPLGGDRDAKVGADLKAEGVKAGVPDLFLPVPSRYAAQFSSIQDRTYHGLWIEMKRPATATQKAGTIAPAQRQWHADLIGQGYACVVCYTWLEAVETLWKYLNGRLGQNHAID